MAGRREIDLRPLGIPEVAMLGRYDYRAAQHGLPPHAHPRMIEICYLAKGRQLYRVGQRDYVLRGGDLFVTFPGESHSTGEAPEEKGRLYWLQLILPARGRRLLSCPPRESAALSRQLLGLPERQFAGASALPRLLDAVFDAAAQTNDPLRRLTIQTRLVEFLLGVIACARRSSRPAVSPLISELLRQLEAPADQPHALAALAARVGLSVPRFKARFKAEVGIPPAEYVLRRRVEQAKQRLARPGVTVTQVAFELGFSSSQYFATVFRRYTGQSPRAFLA